MNNRAMRTFGALCCLCYFCLTLAPAQTDGTPSTEQVKREITRLENEWLSTYISGDKMTYDRIVADDFTGIDESAVLRSKAEDRALLPSAKVPGGSAVNEDMSIRPYGEFAVVTGRIVTKFTAGGREIASFRTRFTDTWARRSGVWQVIARHYSRYPPDRTAIAGDPRLFSELAGKYQIASGVVYEVSVENGKLFGTSAGQPKLEIQPESEAVFFTRTPAALYVFLRGRTGRISHILFIQDGRVIAAKKT